MCIRDSTFTGKFELVKPLSDALDDLQKRTGLDIDIHVDGASGGFLAPFCAPDIVWDFRLPRVKSISTSGHKFGPVSYTHLDVYKRQDPAYCLATSIGSRAIRITSFSPSPPPLPSARPTLSRSPAAPSC